MWLYVPEPVSACSPGSERSTSPLPVSSQESEPWLTWRGKPTRQPFSLRAWRQATWTTLLSGLTSERSPQAISEAVSTWWQAAFPARTSAWPGAVRGLRERGPSSSSGSRISFATYDPATCSWRTSQLSLFEDSTPFSGGWPTSGLMRSGAVYERQTLARHMAAIAGGASRGTASNWPAATVLDSTSTANRTATRTDPSSKHHDGVTLTDAVRMWPTPYGFNGQDKDGGYGTGGKIEKFCKLWATPRVEQFEETPKAWQARAEKVAQRLRAHGIPGQALSIQAATVTLWATPRAGDGEKGGPNQKFSAGGIPLAAQTVQATTGRRPPTTTPDGGPTSTATPTSRLQLNPLFVEALMGLPPGWTDCEPSATPWSQPRPKPRSDCSGTEPLEGGPDA